MARWVQCTRHKPAGGAVVINLETATYIEPKDQGSGAFSVISFVGGGQISVRGEPQAIVTLKPIDAIG